jgi:hypothetical protein
MSDLKKIYESLLNNIEDDFIFIDTMNDKWVYKVLDVQHSKRFGTIYFIRANEDGTKFNTHWEHEYLYNYVMKRNFLKPSEKTLKYYLRRKKLERILK